MLRALVGKMVLGASFLALIRFENFRPNAHSQIMHQFQRQRVVYVLVGP